MNKRLGALAATLLVGSAAAWAQQPPGGERGPAPGMEMGPRSPEGPRQGDPMSEYFFPPELVMQNQKAIGLKEDQQAAIRAEMQKTMGRFTDLQWQQSAEAETMASLVKQDRPDEKQVLAQLDKLLNIENEIKRLHTAMLVKMKNLLTPEQQAKLRDLKRSMRPSAGMRPQQEGRGGTPPGPGGTFGDGQQPPRPRGEGQPGPGGRGGDMIR